MSNRRKAVAVLLLTAGVWMAEGVRCGDTYYRQPDPASMFITRTLVY